MNDNQPYRHTQRAPMNLKGGWVWSIWRRDCVVLQLRMGMLRVGTDDAERLVEYIKFRLANAQHSSRWINNAVISLAARREAESLAAGEFAHVKCSADFRLIE